MYFVHSYSAIPLEKNDLVYMVVDNKNFVDVVKEFGHDEVQAQKIVIIGGGNIGYSLSKEIENNKFKISTNIIEFDKKRSEYLASNLNLVHVTNGDGLDNNILEEVDISEADYFIAVTNDDEVNILSSLLAKRAGAAPGRTGGRPRCAAPASATRPRRRRRPPPTARRRTPGRSRSLLRSTTPCEV